MSECQRHSGLQIKQLLARCLLKKQFLLPENNWTFRLFLACFESNQGTFYYDVLFLLTFMGNECPFEL